MRSRKIKIMDKATYNAMTPYERTLDLIQQKFARYNTEIVKFFTAYDDVAFFQRETAPGKNRASYLLGHLTVANDELFGFLGIGQSLYPDLLPLYFAADRAYPDEQLPSIDTLLQYFNHVNEVLTDRFGKIHLNTWMDKHEKVSEQAFELDPTRTKLSVLLNRLLHLEHHLGQLKLMPKPFEVRMESESNA